MRGKITIINLECDDSIVKCHLAINGAKECITTKVLFSHKNRKVEGSPQIVVDRIDAHVWGILTLAMFMGYDIVSAIPISESLYYNLKYHFIPTLATNNKEWETIDIKVPTLPDIKSENRCIVATGISCGIDSLYSVQSHSTGLPNSHLLNTLAYFNAGSSYYQGDCSMQTELAEGRRRLAEKFAEEYGYNLLYIESNLPLIYSKYHAYSHVENHTYIMLFCSYMIQGSIRHYYYSSGYSYNEFSFEAIEKIHGDASHYDLFTLKMASIGGMQYHSTGAEVTRFEKTRSLVNYEPAQRHLNVCVQSLSNCCTCSKCIRTIFTLEALGALEKFSDVFDIDKFQQRRSFWLQELYKAATYDNDILMQEILPYFTKEITIKMKLRTFLSSIKSKHIKHL